MGGPDPASKADAIADSEMPGTIADIASDGPRFSMFAALFTQADLADTLSNDGPFTVFVPTNEAFARLDPERAARLISGKANADLTALLKRHVAEGSYEAADIMQGETGILALAGTNPAIERAGEMTTADHADLVGADISASNGVIHAIARVIIPIVEAGAATRSDIGVDADSDTKNRYRTTRSVIHPSRRRHEKTPADASPPGFHSIGNPLSPERIPDRLRDRSLTCRAPSLHPQGCSVHQW